MEYKPKFDKVDELSYSLSILCEEGLFCGTLEVTAHRFPEKKWVSYEYFASKAGDIKAGGATFNCGDIECFDDDSWETMIGRGINHCLRRLNDGNSDDIYFKIGNEPKTEFKIGDVVQLKCGGPAMVIADFDNDGDALCRWFSVFDTGIENEPANAFFNVGILEMVPNADGKSNKESKDSYPAISIVPTSENGE